MTPAYVNCFVALEYKPNANRMIVSLCEKGEKVSGKRRKYEKLSKKGKVQITARQL
jgi:hypothetical protein